jgi:hypothetical protein
MTEIVNLAFEAYASTPCRQCALPNTNTIMSRRCVLGAAEFCLLQAQTRGSELRGADACGRGEHSCQVPPQTCMIVIITY